MSFTSRLRALFNRETPGTYWFTTLCPSDDRLRLHGAGYGSSLDAHRAGDEAVAAKCRGLGIERPGDVEIHGGQS